MSVRACRKNLKMMSKDGMMRMMTCSPAAALLRSVRPGVRGSSMLPVLSARPAHNTCQKSENFA